MSKTVDIDSHINISEFFKNDFILTNKFEQFIFDAFTFFEKFYNIPYIIIKMKLINRVKSFRLLEK